MASVTKGRKLPRSQWALAGAARTREPEGLELAPALLLPRCQFLYLKIGLIPPTGELWGGADKEVHVETHGHFP